MNVTLKRTHHLPEATLGQLFIEDVTTDPIYTLENPLRETNLDNRIPAGTYQCKPYSSAKHPDVYEITNVPNRTAILIHTGNVEKDTQGCILIGNRIGALNGEPAILESKRCFERFRSLIGHREFTLVVED
jgi:hypothetical protein